MKHIVPAQSQGEEERSVTEMRLYTQITVWAKYMLYALIHSHAYNG